MRTLKLHFADDALPTLNTFLQQTQEARIFRQRWQWNILAHLYDVTHGHLLARRMYSAQ
jgi:hypothetical protein